MNSQISWSIAVGVALCSILSVQPGCRKKVEKNGAPSINADGASRDSATAFKTTDKQALDVMQELRDAWNSVDAFSVDLTVRAKRDIGDRAHSRGDGKYRFMKDEVGTYLYYNVTSSIYFWVGDDGYFTGERVEYSTDGETLERLMSIHEDRELLRTTYSPEKVLHLGGDYLYNLLLEDYALEVTSEKEFGEQVIVAFRAEPGDGTWSTYEFDKATGILLRLIEHEKDGQGEEDVRFSVICTNLDLSPEFTSEHFLVEIPSHVTIIDETGPERKVTPPEPIHEDALGDHPHEHAPEDDE